MGCNESKLAAATVDPIKRPKSASSRSSSRRIERLDSNTTTATTSVATIIAYSEKAADVVKEDEHKKAVKSKACQTMDYCSKERIEKKSKNGLIGCNEGGNDVVVSKEEGDEQDESLVFFSEEDKKIESAMMEENENKERMGEEIKEVETFEGREQEEVKIEEEEGQNTNDQVQATKVEEAQAGKPSEPKAKDETMVADEKWEAQDANDKFEVAEEEQESVESIEVETKTVVKEETEKIVSNNVDDQVHVAKQDEAHGHDGELVEVEAETMVLVETETIMPDKVDDQVSVDVEKVDPIELEDGTLNKENIKDPEA